MTLSLTDEQTAIVAHRDGPSLVLAVAGSGKTTTILKRIDALIALGVAPREILLTTFSRAGAADMDRRARKLFVRRGVEYRTIHSLAWGAIKKAGKPWLLPPTWWPREVIEGAIEKFEALAENRDRQAAERRRSEAQALVAAGASPIDLAFGLRGALGVAEEEDSWQVSQVPTPKEVLHWIGRAKANLVRPDAWSDALGVSYMSFVDWARTVGLDLSMARLIDFCYRTLETERADPVGRGHTLSGFKRGDVACDHDDAMLEVARAVRVGDPWIDKVRGTYRHVVIDEAQDCNLAQWVFVRFLARELSRTSLCGTTSTWQNLMVVGDPGQAIYEWRGTRPDLLADMISVEGPSLSFYALTMNFRSGQKIIDVVNKILRKVKGRLSRDELRCGRPDIDAEVTLRLCGDAQDEAEIVVDGIQRSLAEGRSPSEIAVLYRINALSGPIEIELIRRQIPYRVAGSGFFMRPEVDAAVKYIALALDPDDVEAYETVYRVPRRWINKKFLASFPKFSSLRGHKPGELAARWKGANRLLKDMDKLIERLRDDGLVAALEFIFDVIGVRKHFIRMAGESPDDDMSEIDETLRVLLACAETAGDPKRFIEFARDMRSGTIGQQDPDGERVDDRVTLSSVHRSKGIEWEEVFLIGATEGLLPLGRGEPGEEQRLCYVAVSRPKKALRISCAGRREGEHTRPSPLVYDAGLLDRQRQPSGAIDWDAELVDE